MNISATTYELLHAAYDHFNVTLFEGRLPTAMLVLHRKRNSHGYFWNDQWQQRGDNEPSIHEIALNPETLSRPPAEVLSTLVHEMTHLEQQVFGKPSKGGHHNKEWVKLIEAVGLTPYATDGSGKQTGRKVSHTIDPGGRFDVSCNDFLAANPDALTVFAAAAAAGKERKKDLSKVKHSCPCCDANVWGKLGIRVICGECDEVMLPPDDLEGEED